MLIENKDRSQIIQPSKKLVLRARLSRAITFSKAIIFPWLTIKELRFYFKKIGTGNTALNTVCSQLTMEHNQLITENSKLNNAYLKMSMDNSKILAQHEDINVEILKIQDTNQKILEENARLCNENSILAEKLATLRNNNAKLVFEQKGIRSGIPIDSIAGMLNWPEILSDVDNAHGLSELIRLFSIFSTEETIANTPSDCWELLASKNCDQLLEYGYHNFKRTIGHNYFNFLVQKNDPQIETAESLVPVETIEQCKERAAAIPHDPWFTTNDQYSYYYFVLLLWEYVKKIDVKNHLDSLQEPKEGNPLLVCADEKSMSQDLANSLIEYYAIDQSASFQTINSVLEIGGGYGRNAHVILSLNPNAKIVLVDILPALYIAQRYLSSVFNDRKVFKARKFFCYDEVKDELESSSIVFLLPHQLSLIPDKQFDLAMNVSSFGEMSLDQISWYFNQIKRLTCKYFYMKQWDVSKNPFDNLVITKSDYPYPEKWKQIYTRNCAVQTEFFETLYEVS